MTMIDWSRMAQPQDDGYDTKKTIPLAQERYGWTKKYPAKDAITWLDGQVTLRPGTGDNSSMMQAVDPPRALVEDAEHMLKTVWPACYAQLQTLLQTVYTYSNPAVGKKDRWGTGCSCGPMGDRVSFEIAVTVDSPIGMLEGVVHEFGHNKLKAYGVSLLHWERLVANAPASVEDELAGTGPNVYDSPIRKDKKRPMGACLSAWYAYLYVTELIVRLRDRFPEANLGSWARFNAERIIDGAKLVVDHVVPDGPDGEAFFAAATAWAYDLDTRTR